MVPPGTPVSLLRSDCPNCEGQAILETPPVQKEALEAPEEASQVTFEFLPPPMDESTIEGLVYARPPVGDDGEKKKAFSGYVNRITPVILASQIIADMMNREIDLDQESVIESFNSVSTEYRKNLQKAEEAHNIPRGMRLSDGFPKDSEKAIKRFSRTYIGADPEKGTFSPGDGLSQRLGLISLEHDTGEEAVRVRLTEVGKETLKIKLQRDIEVSTEKHRAAGIKGEISLPKWMSNNDVERLLRVIENRSNGEYLWIRYLLEQIDSSISGLTADALVQSEVEREITETERKRWFDRGSDTPIVQERQSRGIDEDSICIDLDSKISSTIVGTLSRMKEMSLIFQFKKARKTYYKSTALGKQWVHRWDSLDL